MIYKYFTNEDIVPVAKLCRQTMPLDIMPDFLLKEKTIEDPDFDKELTIIALSKDAKEPIAFIQGVIRSRDEGLVGYIKLICVNDNFRRKGIAASLLKQVEDKMKGRGVNVVRVYESYPNYFMPGVDPFYTEAVCFFERSGYKKFNDTSNLICDLTNKDFTTEKEEAILLKDDIVCKRAEENDRENINDWLEKNFAAWKAEVSASYWNTPVSLHIALLKGKVVAFSAYEANNRGTGWFGPMGTDKVLRGKKVGGILLKRCLADMKQMGFVKAIIPWVGPIPFYMHYADAKVQRVFWRYEKYFNK
jgi:GNAT superfamily N-acetyltransferase